MTFKYAGGVSNRVRLVHMQGAGEFHKGILAAGSCRHPDVRVCDRTADTITNSQPTFAQTCNIGPQDIAKRQQADTSMRMCSVDLETGMIAKTTDGVSS